MKLVNVDLKYILLIFLISIVMVFDLFSNVGRSANGDGLIHTIVPTLFARTLVEGNFPVGWVDGFANYGMPLGSVSQQITTYLTAIVTIFSHNPALGYNSVVFLGVLLSNISLYIFLRIYFLPLYSFAGVFLFSFTPYRILNIYIRGALPEFFAGVFFPLILIAMYILIVKKNIYGLILFITSFCLLTLTHPFMDVVVVFLAAPYGIFLLLQNRVPLHRFITMVLALAMGGLLSILMTGYYSLPLTLEIKYFYYGLSHNHLTPNNFLGLSNFFTYQYPYFTKLDIFNRGFVVTVGLVETLLALCAIVFVLYRFTTKKIFTSPSLIDFTALTSLLCIGMMTNISQPLYAHVGFLSNIQFPWRMLSAFIFLPPIALAFFLSKLNKTIVALGVILVVALLAFPELYGKNYTNYPYSFYTFTPLNLNAVVMNTIWTGNTEDYPIAQNKAAIISGSGKILSQEVTDEKRIYSVDAKTQLQLVDRTFYFPGWQVHVDGITTPIQYQDPNYRGVITYHLSPGLHTVLVTYKDTKVRLLGKIISLVSCCGFVLLVILRKRLQHFFV